MKCNDCDKPVDPDEAFCAKCADHSECVHEHDVRPESMFDNPATLVRDWTDRRRALFGMSDETAELLELCAEDISR